MISVSPRLTFLFRLTYSTWHPLVLHFKYWLTVQEWEYRLRKSSSKSLSIFVIKYVWPVTPLITLPVQQRIDTSARVIEKYCWLTAGTVPRDLLLTPVKPNALQLFNLARWNRHLYFFSRRPYTTYGVWKVVCLQASKNRVYEVYFGEVRHLNCYHIFLSLHHVASLLVRICWMYSMWGWDFFPKM